jgi:hypothetical protein
MENNTIKNITYNYGNKNANTNQIIDVGSDIISIIQTNYNNNDNNNDNKIVKMDVNENINNIYDIFGEKDNKKNNKNNKNIKNKNEMDENKKDKKRVVTEKWDFEDKYYLYDNQIEMINNIINNNYCQYDSVSNIVIQQINRKIYGYKQQDLIKNILDINELIDFKSVVDKMHECKLKCYYCKIEMNILYEISREMKQWSVDRINNYLGHNKNNFYLACLECNLKRRRRNDDSFLFTKQLKLVKLKDDKDFTSFIE